MQTAPLNVFQQTQSLWEKDHPYNAAQFATLTLNFPLARLTETFNQAVNDLGLGTFVRVDNRYWIDRVDYTSKSVCEAVDLESLLAKELNRAFDPLASFPLRPFVTTESHQQTLGVVYQHWVADSVSVRIFMRAWLSRLLDRPDLRPQKIRLDNLGTLARFSPASSGWSVIQHALDVIGFTRTMKRMRRVESASTDQTVATLVHTMETGAVDRIRTASRQLGVTVGDLFLAASAEACAIHGPNFASKRRTNLAIGTIVDLRNRHPHLDDRIFSLFLGFMVSDFRSTDFDSFQLIVHRAKLLRQTQNHKRSAEASQLRMWIGQQIARRLPKYERLEFYRKRFPLAGGISNVNLTNSWLGSLTPNPIIRYHRVSPTGPLMPIVFTPTTLGQELSLCCTYKTVLLTRDRATQIVNTMIDRLTNL